MSCCCCGSSCYCLDRRFCCHGSDALSNERMLLHLLPIIMCRTLQNLSLSGTVVGSGLFSWSLLCVPVHLLYHTTCTVDNFNTAHSLTHSLTHNHTHSLTHSLSHPLTHSLTHSLTISLTHNLTHSQSHSLTISLTHDSLCFYRRKIVGEPARASD